MTVRYTPGQLRDAVGISQETYRHWKKALPPLRGGAGHGPRYAAGDLLAAAIVKILTTQFAIRVGAVAAIARALFSACAAPWPELERGKLIVDLAAGDLQFIGDNKPSAFQAPVLVIPLRSPTERLRAMLLAGLEPGTQGFLPFPPAQTSPIASADTMEVQG